MGKLLEFGNLSFKLLYPLFLSIFCFLSSICNVYLKDIYNHKVILSFIDSLSLILCGTLELISILIFPKKVKIEKENDINVINYKTNIIQPKYSKKISIIHLFFDCLVYFVNQIILVFLRYIEIDGFDEPFTIIHVIISGVLCYFIFGTKFYKHHFISLIIIIISASFSTTVSIINDKPQVDWLYFLLYFIHNFSYSSFEVYEKWIMHYQFISPYLILFCEGIFTLILKSIIITILAYTPCKISSICQEGEPFVNFKLFFQIISHNHLLILYITLSILAHGALHIFRILTSKHYTPTHRIVADTLALIYVFIYFQIISDSSVYEPIPNPPFIIIKIIAYSTIFISCLIYHEFIILKFCSLDEYTQKEINKRAINEFTNDGLFLEKEINGNISQNSINGDSIQ